MTAAEGHEVYGALCRRLDANWHVLRHCRVAVKGEEHTLQLVIVHREFGIGLIAFRAEAYTFPELAIRLTRAMLRARGFEERFAGFLPIVFIAIDSHDPHAVPTRIARAFAEQPALGIADPSWADWAALTLGRVAAEGRQGLSGSVASEETSDEPPAAVRREALREEVGDDVIDLTLDPASHATETATARRIRRSIPAIALSLIVASVIGACIVGWGPWRIDLRSSSPAVSVAVPPVGAGPATPRPPAAWNVRLLNEENAARYLGLDVETFRRKHDALKAAGFPSPEPVTGGYDRTAIDRWLDTRAGRS